MVAAASNGVCWGGGLSGLAEETSSPGVLRCPAISNEPRAASAGIPCSGSASVIRPGTEWKSAHTGRQQCSDSTSWQSASIGRGRSATPAEAAVRLYHKDWVGGGKPTCRWWGRRIGAPGSTTHLLEEGSAPTPIFITDVRELYSTAITASILRAFSSAATEPFPFSKSPSRTCSRIHLVVAGTPRRALHPSAWAPSIRSFLSFDPGGASDCDGMVGLFH